GVGVAAFAEQELAAVWKFNLDAAAADLHEPIERRFGARRRIKSVDDARGGARKDIGRGGAGIRHGQESKSAKPSIKDRAAMLFPGPALNALFIRFRSASTFGVARAQMHFQHFCVFEPAAVRGDARHRKSVPPAPPEPAAYVLVQEVQRLTEH